MLNLDVYNLRTKQNFMAMLTQFESEGITDVRFIRQRVQNHIEKSSAGSGPIQRVKRVRKTRIPIVRCPEPDCGTVMRFANTGDEDIKVLVCPKCRFSKVVS